MRWSKLLAFLLAGSLAAGCELISIFDRNKIETDGAGTTTTPIGGGGTGGVVGANGGTGGVGGTTATCDPADCPAPSGECKVAICDATGMCAEEDVADGMDAATQIDGDCKKNVCMSGAVIEAADDNDVENDMKTCTLDSCANKVVVHDPNVAGAACTEDGGKVCDDAKNCVECNDDNDCVGAAGGNTVCDAPNHVCVLPHCMNAVVDSGETDFNCGGADCAPCADTLMCMDDSDCQSNNCPGTVCVAGTCVDGIINNMQLGETDVDCGGTCPGCGFDETCGVNADCKGGECTTMKCAANCMDTEKDQDESDVDCGGVCTDCINGKDCNSKADCVSNFCNPGKKCAACANDGECAAAEYCLSGSCVPDKVTGLSCTAGTQCQTNNCIDGFCCGSMVCGTCQSCGIAGSEGTCSAVASGPDDTCTGTQACAAGVCKKNNGQLCPTGMDSQCLNGHCVDGYCCDAACAGTCKACNVLGNNGACVNVLMNSQDPVTCAAAGQVCDGAGGCKKAIGQACPGGNSECVNNQCVDGFCCSTTCTATCKSCGVAGSLGTCTNIPNGTTDTNATVTCIGSNSCDGAGGCKKNDGTSCAGGVDADCVHGHCTDTICCNAACNGANGTCEACNIAGKLGMCSHYLAGEDPDNECPGGTNYCNGATACGLGAMGAPCVVGVVDACVGGVTCPAGGICP